VLLARGNAEKDAVAEFRPRIVQHFVDIAATRLLNARIRDGHFETAPSKKIAFRFAPARLVEKSFIRRTLRLDFGGWRRPASRLAGVASASSTPGL
jgi:hypothetical protein